MLRLRLAASAVLCVWAGAASAQTGFQWQVAAAAVSASARPIPNADLWGAMGRLGGTAWLDPADGTVWEFKWDEPGEVMTWLSHKPQEELINRASINARGSVSVETASIVGLLTVQSDDVIRIERQDTWREYLRATGTRLSYEYQQRENGAWTTKHTREMKPLRSTEVATAIAALAPKQKAYRAQVAAKEAAQRAEAAAKEAERNSPWGIVSAMQGRRFVGSDGEFHLILSFRSKKFKGWDAVSVWSQKYDDTRGWEEFIYNDLSNGEVRFQADDNSSDKIFFGPDRTFGYFHLRFRLLPDGNLEVTEGKWRKSDNTFTPRKEPWIWRAYSDDEYAQRMAQIEQSKAQSSGGGSGFGSILAGAAMGAILGGGGQSSVDLAVAAAQAAAQGGNTLDVLNSMGNVAAANAAESKRQLDETIARAQGGTSASSASTGSMAYGAAGSSMAGSASGSSAHALTRKTLQVYFWIGTSPNMGTGTDEGDGHNTHCQSNIFNVTIDWDPSLEASGGNLKYANALLDPMKSTFIDKCDRTDPSRPTVGIADWYADAFSGWHPESLQLRKGDLEVMMP